MSNKKYRFQVIKELISTAEIGSQDELLKRLMDLDINVTQATLSRDLRELKVSKFPNHNGNYIYKLTETEATHQTIPHTNQVSLTFSKNLGVIRTKPGYATSLAFEIDNSNLKSIIGTLAGDDTVLIIMKEDSSRDEVANELKTIIPNINK